MNTRIKWLMAVLLATATVCVIAVAFMAAHRTDPDDEDEQEEVKTPSHVFVENGRTMIRLDARTQAREGIEVAAVQQVSRRAELRGTAVILPVGDLAVLRNSYVAAQSKLERDQVGLKVAGSQDERTKKLYQQNQNMSLKAVQDADAAWRTDQAQVAADKQDAELQLETVRQRWGQAMAGWVAASAPTLQAVLEQRAFLAQLIFPPDQEARPPARLSLATPGNRLAPAQLAGPMPQVNPQIQGVSFLYLVSSRPGMAAGMNLAALVPVGPLLRGSVIPVSAVVWWQGKAWAYQESSENTFTRHEVPTQNPLSDGYFVPGNAFARTKIVTAGAQALLSEEFRSQIQQED
ncbi:MAG TPA: hypothetical protein VGR48_09650 [Terriglobales bacterium]|nr:hypothetical protein [Terriglobales bacterium]